MAWRLTLCALLLASRLGLAAEITISCGSVGREFDLCNSASQRWASLTGNRVQVLSAPAGSGERLSTYQLLLAAGSSDIDVFLLDTTWSGIIGDFLIDLKPALPTGVARDFIKASIENNTVQGRLVAIPWFIDAGVLLYREDLLKKHGEKVPRTWQEVTAAAKRIQDGERRAGNASLWGYVFQGRAYEGLTCNALEWISSFGGGGIVAPDGTVTVDNESAIKALELAASWIGTISPKAVLNYTEEEARGAFQTGHAVFMRNWPYALKLAQASDSPIRGKVAMAPLPTATLGGWSLGVSRYSRNPSASAELVAYLTGRDEVKRRALLAGLAPALRSLYDDPELTAANPYFRELQRVFSRAVARPSNVTRTRYNRVSSEFWDGVHAILAGKTTARAGLKQLAEALNRVKRKGW